MTRVVEGLQEERRQFISFEPARSPVAGQAKSKATKPPRKVCVLVLGMHRSGASAFARVLNLLGCDLPNSVVQANGATEGAPEDSDAIRQLNDRILASAGTRWDDWVEFHPGWLQSPRAEEFQDEALELLRQEFGASRLFVLKDPRMCRLVPFWLGVLKAAGVQPLILSPVSSPLAVAAALEQRDGLAPGLGHLIWLRHVLDAEFASRGAKRFFTSYDRLTSGWARTTTAASSTLGIAWPRLSDKTAAEIETFLSNRCGDDRRQVGNVQDNPTLSDWLRTTSEILGRWSVEGEAPQDYATLDEIRIAMNTAAPAFSRLLGTEKARNERLASELASERQLKSELESRAEEAEQAALQLKSELESRAEAAEQAALQLRSELESRAEAAEQAALQLKSELESRAEAAERELASERAQMSQLKSKLESRAEAAEQALASERRRQEQATAEAEKSLTEVRHRLAQTESALAQRSHEAEQTASELAAAREELRQARAGRAEAEKVSAGLMQHLDVLMAEVKQRQIQAAEQADTDASLARQVKQVLALLDTSRHELASRLSEAEQVRITQTAELQQRLYDIEALKSEAECLRQVAALEIGRAAGLVNGKGTSALRRRFHRMWRAAFLKRSGLFDAEWYLQHNADVAGAGIDPLQHYIEFGAKEGRAPNPALMSNGKR